MYAITAHYHRESRNRNPRFTVRCGHMTSTQPYDHDATPNAGIAAIQAHVASCQPCHRMLRHMDGDGYELVYATLPTASGMDGDEVAVWRYLDE